MFTLITATALDAKHCFYIITLDQCKTFYAKDLAEFGNRFPHLCENFLSAQFHGEYDLPHGEGQDFQFATFPN